MTLVAFFFLPYMLLSEFWESIPSPKEMSYNLLHETSEGTLLAFSFTGGYARSTNYGNSWEHSTFDVKFPLDPDLRYEENYSPIISEAANHPDGSIYAISSIGSLLGYYKCFLIRSADDGKSWSIIKTNLRFSNQIEIDKDGVIYVNQGDPDLGYGLNLSTDGGYTWIKRNIYDKEYQLYIPDIERGANNRIYVRLNNQKVFFTDNRGESFTELTYYKFPMHYKINDIFADNDMIYLLGEGGKDYFSFDNAATFHFSPAAHSNELKYWNYIKSIHKTSQGMVLLTNGDSYIIKDTNATYNTDPHLEFDHAQTALTGIVTSSGDMMKSYYGHGIFFKHRAMNIWEPISSGLEATTSLPLTGLFVKSSNELIASYTYKLKNDPSEDLLNDFSIIYSTSDGGKNWTKRIENWNMAFDKFIATKNKIFAVNSKGIGFYYSTDLGENWQLVQPEFSKYRVNDMHVDDSSNVYISCQMLGILKSDDNGKLWFAENWGLRDSTRTEAIYKTNNGTLVAFDRKMIYHKTPDMEFWRNTNLTPEVLLSFARPGSFHHFTEDTKGTIYAIGEDYLINSTDNGNSWSLIKRTSVQDENAKLIIGKTDIMYSLNPFNDYYKSEFAFSLDYGKKWVPLKDGFRESSRNFAGYTSVLDKSFDGYLVADYSGVIYKTQLPVDEMKFYDMEVISESGNELDKGKTHNFSVRIFDSKNSTLKNSPIAVRNEINGENIVIITDDKGIAKYSFYVYYDMPSVTNSISFTSLADGLYYEIRSKDSYTINPGGLQFSLLDSSAQTVYINQKYGFTFFVKDSIGNPVDKTTIAFNDPITNEKVKLVSSDKGIATYDVNFDINFVEGMYKFNFVATKGNLASRSLQSIVNIKKPKIHIEVTPVTHPVIQWYDSVRYTIKATINGAMASDTRIIVESDYPEGWDTILTTDKYGIAEFRQYITEKALVKEINYTFQGEKAKYGSSDIVARHLKVSHGQRLKMYVAPSDTLYFTNKSTTIFKYNIEISAPSGAMPGYYYFLSVTAFGDSATTLKFDPKFTFDIKIPEGTPTGTYLYTFRAEADPFLPVEVIRVVEIVDSIVSVREPIFDSSIEVYPNPASDEIYFRSSEKSYSGGYIFDISGEKVREFAILREDEAISVSGLPRGTYILILRDKHTTTGKKFIIE